MTMSRLATLLVFATTLGALAFTTTPALATGDANTETCPASTEASPGFHAYLPDCRAYEQVTPVFKDGSEMELEGLSEDGSHVIGRVLGTFAGLENNTNLNGGTYELVRGPSGWTVQAISPPSSEFPVQEFYAASTDLTKTLWLTRTPSESVAAENFYIREPDGTMVKVGSLLPPSVTAGPPAGPFGSFLYKTQAEYVDASDNFSHVFFRIERGKEFGISWPGDATAGSALSSLYEYSGTGQPLPELVGVSDGSTVVSGDNEGRPLPTGQLISTCGTWLGSDGSKDVYNAVSASGATVFFTAEGKSECGAAEGPPVNELYARLGQEQTVPISEPTTGAHGACGACNDTEPRSATFLGASEDGSKVFFLTTQELLPGAKGENLYEYDFDGPVTGRVRQVSVGAPSGEPEVQGVARVSEDGSHVYFVARGRLGEGPRGGTEQEGHEGPCLAELGGPEKAQEAIAATEESKAELVTTNAKCRPTPKAENLYVYERDATYPAGHVSFIATLCSGEGASGLTADGLCTSEQGDEADWSTSDQRLVQATPDGRFLVFSSVADLAEGDTSAEPQIFEYDALTGELVRVSNERAGYSPVEPKLDADNNQAVFGERGYSVKTVPTEANEVNVSNAGSTVVFSSQGALTPEAEKAAAAHVHNAYEYRSSVANGGSISAGDVYLISGESTEASREAVVTDGAGQNVFFAAATQLLPGDTDTQFDTYDARSDGGFLAPDPPAGCVAEACFSSLYAPPSVQAPGSESISATSPASSVTSLPPVVMTPKAMTVKCKRGFIKKKNKCAKDRSKKKTAKKNGNDRRAES
jgi:hypothetical protein